MYKKKGHTLKAGEFASIATDIGCCTTAEKIEYVEKGKQEEGDLDRQTIGGERKG